MTLAQALTEAEARRRNRPARPAKPSRKATCVKANTLTNEEVVAWLGRIRQELNEL